jgi:hypothetical protein
MARPSLSRRIGGTIGTIGIMATTVTIATTVAGNSGDARRPLRSSRDCGRRELQCSRRFSDLNRHVDRSSTARPHGRASSRIRYASRIQFPCTSPPKSVPNDALARLLKVPTALQDADRSQLCGSNGYGGSVFHPTLYSRIIFGRLICSGESGASRPNVIGE